MLKKYDPTKHDIVIVGHHGAMQLSQAGVSLKKYFKLPEKDANINVAPLIDMCSSTNRPLFLSNLYIFNGAGY